MITFQSLSYGVCLVEYSLMFEGIVGFGERGLPSTAPNYCGFTVFWDIRILLYCLLIEINGCSTKV